MAKLEQSVFMYIDLRWASFQLLLSDYYWFGFFIIDLARLTWISYGVASFFFSIDTSSVETSVVPHPTLQREWKRYSEYSVLKQETVHFYRFLNFRKQ